MSRIGNKPISVPNGAKLSVQGNVIHAEGPKGKLSQAIDSSDITIEVNGEEVLVKRLNDLKPTKAMHGLYRNLINNMLIGVTEGFKRSLVINGIGYKAEVQGKLLMLSLGYSTDMYVAIPDGISITLENNNQKIVVSGIDKQKVGKLASEIRSLRLPEPYKGKGIRYDDEVVRKKVGKTGIK